MVAPTPGAVGTQRTGSTSTPAFAAPAGVGADKIVAIAFFLDGATTISAMPDASWNHAPGSPLYVNVNSHSLNVLWARNPAGSTYTVTLSGSAYSEGGAVRYDNCVASGSPWDTNSGIGAAVATDATSGTVTPAVSMTTQSADQCNVHVATNWGGGTWTPQSGYTKELGANVGLVTLSDKGQAVAGATGSVSATSTTADKRGAWLGSLLPVSGGTAAPGSIRSEERFGTGLLVPLLNPGSIQSSERFGTGLLVPILNPGSIQSGERFGASVLTPGTASAIPGSVGSGEAFGTSVLTPGVMSLTPGSVKSEERFGASVLTPGGVSPTPGVIQSGEQFGTSLLSPGAVSVVPGSAVSQEQWGTSVISSGGSPAQTLSPGSIVSSEAFGASVLSPGAVSIAPGSINTAEQFGTSTVGGVAAALAPGAIGSQERWGAGLLSPGPASLAPGSISSLEMWGRGILASDQTLAPGSIRSSETWGRSTVGSNPPQTVAPGTIYTNEKWGTSLIEYGARTPTHFVTAGPQKFEVEIEIQRFAVRYVRRSYEVEMEQ